MRRYSPVSSPFTLGRFLVFFGAWNLIGMTIYTYIIKKEEEKEPGKWKDASGGQHYLRFINFGSQDVRKVTLKGLSSITVEDLKEDDIQKLKGYNSSEN